MVVTTYGEWGGEATTFLDRLSTRVAMQTATAKAEVSQAMYTRLNFLLMRSNAQALLTRGGQTTLGRFELVLGGDPA